MRTEELFFFHNCWSGNTNPCCHSLANEASLAHPAWTRPLIQVSMILNIATPSSVIGRPGVWQPTSRHDDRAMKKAIARDDRTSTIQK